MNPKFRNSLIWSAAAHVILLVSLACLVGFSIPHKEPESITWVELPSAGNPAPPVLVPALPEAPVDPTPSPPPPIPDQATPPLIPPSPSPAVDPLPKLPEPPTVPEHQPVPPPPTPQPVPPTPPPRQPPKPPAPKTPAVDDKPAKPQKPKVEVSRTVVRRSPSSQAKPSPPVKGADPRTSPSTFDPKAFARRLAGKFSTMPGLVTARPTAGSGTGAAGTTSEFAAYYNHIFQEMYAVWRPPLGLAEGMETKVLLRIEKTGVISQVSLVSSSNNQPMDESALAAANQVKKLRPPPEELVKPAALITVAFQIQK